MNKFEQAYLSIINEETNGKNSAFEFSYRLLSRLKSDCEYFLGHGNRCEKHLWAGNVEDQIEKMKELYEKVPEKPEWLTYDEILDYEKRMKEEPTEIEESEIIEEDTTDTVVLFDSSADDYDFDEIKEMLKEDGIEEPTDENVYSYIDDSISADLEFLKDNIEVIDKQNIKGHIVAIGDIGRWNGRKFGLKELVTLPEMFEKCLYNLDDLRIYVENGDLIASGSHHDGRNVIIFREIAPEYYFDDIEEVAYEKPAAEAKKEIIEKYTLPIGQFFTEF